MESAFGATKFVARNLFEMTPELLVADGAADKWLVDPPREGAFSLVQALAELSQRKVDGRATAAEKAWFAPKRIVYVSCNPATLARDAGVLVTQAGYRCTQCGGGEYVPPHGPRGEHGRVSTWWISRRDCVLVFGFGRLRLGLWIWPWAPQMISSAGRWWRWLQALGCHALNLVVPHVLVHLFPAGKDGGAGCFLVQRIAVFNAAQAVAAGTAHGFGVRFLLGHLGVGQQGFQVATRQQQGHGEGESGRSGA